MRNFSICYKNLKTDTLPSFIYIDTSFWHEAIVKGQKFHNECIAFLSRIQKEQNIAVVCSILVKTELMCSILRLMVRNEIPKKDSVMFHLKKNPDDIKRHQPMIKNAIKTFKEIIEGFYYFVEAPLNSEITNASLELMGKYRLCSYDAQHVSTMDNLDIRDIATIDKDLAFLPKYRKDTYIWSPKKYS